MSETPVLELIDICRRFSQADQELNILDGVGLNIRRGEIVALVGPSGAGKSTLLQIAGLLEKPDGGQVVIEGADCTAMGDAERTRKRLDTLGFVYQYHHLLPEFSALENVVVPQMIAGMSREEATERARALLQTMRLEQRAQHRPARLSGGEQQRVAIARALANVPALLLADEPTGNLDPQTAATVFDLLLRLVRQTGLAAFIATHNPELAARMDRVVRIEGGHLIEQGQT